MSPRIPQIPRDRVPNLVAAGRGQARVRLNGHEIWLGRMDDPTTRDRYEQVIAAWETNGRRWPAPLPRSAHTLHVSELADRYLTWAITYYQRPAEPPPEQPSTRRKTSSTTTRPEKPTHKKPHKTGHIVKVRTALALLLRCSLDDRTHTSLGSITANAFGPPQLERYQAFLAADPEQRWSRSTINTYTGLVRAMFLWGVRRGHVLSGVPERLRSVPALRADRPVGETGLIARETTPQPRHSADGDASRRAFERVLAACPPMLRAMVEVQRLTAMRPGELVAMRAGDVVTLDDGTALYAPRRHKTAHHGKSRMIAIGPRALSLLRPYLDAARTCRISPLPAESRPIWRTSTARREAGAMTRAARAKAGRDTRSDAAASSRPPPEGTGTVGDVYTVQAYGKAIARICDKLKLRGSARITPYGLRHAGATEIAAASTLTVAKEILGHSSIRTTQLYVHPLLSDGEARKLIAGR